MADVPIFAYWGPVACRPAEGRTHTHLLKCVLTRMPLATRQPKEPES